VKQRSATFSELAAERMRAREAYLAESSRATDEIRLQPLLQRFGKLAAKRITAAQIESYLAGLVTRGTNRSTANRYRALLSSIFRLGVRNRRVRSNPLGEVPRFKEAAARVRFLSGMEERAIRRALAGHPLRAAEFTLALHTGLRRGELFDLRIEDVDLRRGLLRASGKTGQRFVPLNRAARQAARKMLGRTRGPWLIPERRAPAGKRDQRRWFERALRAARVSNFRWHDLRHTFASRLVMAGCELRAVQELLGHKGIAMTLRYSHLSPQHLKGSVKRLDR